MKTLNPTESPIIPLISKSLKVSEANDILVNSRPEFQPKYFTSQINLDKTYPSYKLLFQFGNFPSQRLDKVILQPLLNEKEEINETTIIIISYKVRKD